MPQLLGAVTVPALRVIWVSDTDADRLLRVSGPTVTVAPAKLSVSPLGSVQPIPLEPIVPEPESVGSGRSSVTGPASSTAVPFGTLTPDGKTWLMIDPSRPVQTPPELELD